MFYNFQFVLNIFSKHDTMHISLVLVLFSPYPKYVPPPLIFHWLQHPRARNKCSQRQLRLVQIHTPAMRMRSCCVCKWNSCPSASVFVFKLAHKHTPLNRIYRHPQLQGSVYIPAPPTHFLLSLSKPSVCMYLCLESENSWTTNFPLTHWLEQTINRLLCSVVFPLKLLCYPGNSFCFR